MKASNFSETQIAFVLKQAEDGSAVAEVCRKVDLRVSQINGCSFCVDMHVKAATMHAERPLRLHHVAAWRESTLFTPRERAALEWSEVITEILTGGVSDEVYRIVRAQFSEQELSDLTFFVMSINA